MKVRFLRDSFSLISKCLIALFMLSLYPANIFAQTGIATNSPEAALDIQSTNAGLLMPRIALLSATDATSVINPNGGALEVSTMVYNTGAGGLSPAGFYYWNGYKWLQFEKTEPEVYMGKFIITSTGFHTVTGLPFEPKSISFVGYANVETYTLNSDNGVGNNNSGIANSFGYMKGYCQNNDGITQQQVIYGGASGNSVNDISRFASSTHCIGLRYSNVNGDLLGLTTASMDTIYTDGFRLNVDAYADNLVVLYEAHKYGIVDFDGDGIADIYDIDDDNDGIVDTAEFQKNTLSFSGGDGGSTHSTNQVDPVTMTLDLTTIDNSFGARVNGIDIHPDYSNFELETGQLDVSGEVYLVFDDNSLMGSPWVANTENLPRIRIFINEAGAVEIYGTRATNSTFLERMKPLDNSSFSTITYLSGSNSFEIINPDENGLDGLSGAFRMYYTSDGDNDGKINSRDLDSDADGCSDALEAGMTASLDTDFNFGNTNVGTNGLSNSLETVDNSGVTTISPNTSDPYNSGVHTCN